MKKRYQWHGVKYLAALALWHGINISETSIMAKSIGVNNGGEKATYGEINSNQRSMARIGVANNIVLPFSLRYRQRYGSDEMA